MPRNTIHVEVDRKTKQSVTALAKKRKVSNSDVVRWAIDSYLAGCERAKALTEPAQPKEAQQ